MPSVTNEKMDEITEQVEKAYDLGEKSREALSDYWKEHVYFTWEWWFAIAIFFLVWISWFLFRKKESTDRLMYSGLFVIIISSWLNFLGVHYGLWYYKIDIIPTPPSFILWDFCLMPVTIMFVLQYKPTFNPYIKAVIFSCLASFIGEPLFEWGGYYMRESWEYYYSFPIDIIINLSAYFISKRKRFAKV